MALWKETMQNEQGERPMAERPAGERLAEEMPPPVSSIAQRKESFARDRKESVFGPGVTIEGKIEGDADVRIGGNFKGDIHIKGDLNIEKGAHLTAKISAATVSIAGELEGNVVASTQVKLLESGQIIGDLKAATLTVVAGSRMRGNVEFGWSDAESAKIANIRGSDKAKSGSAV